MHGLNSAMQTEDALVEQSPTKRIGQPVPPERPGALHGEIWLTVQTSLAQKLLHGRAGTTEKPAIIGLVGFANRIRVIWLAARRDDPYADWWLIKVHEAIQCAENDVRDMQAILAADLDGISAMEVNIAQSQKPYRVQLRFANPYAYRAARLIAELDKLVCMVMTSRHIGLFSAEASENIVKACARKFRAIFVIPQGYRLMKIDRDTVRRGIGRASEARQIMGVVPEDILSGERLAPIVPRRIQLPSRLAEHVGLTARPSCGNGASK